MHGSTYSYIVISDTEVVYTEQNNKVERLLQHKLNKSSAAAEMAAHAAQVAFEFNSYFSSNL